MDSPPTDYQQARERARDDLSRVELTNMLYHLPDVAEIDVLGEAQSWRDTIIVVGFADSHGEGTDEITSIMRRAGWQVESVTFSLDRIRFEQMTNTDVEIHYP